MSTILPLASIHIDDTLNVSREGKPIPVTDVVGLAADFQRDGQLEPVGVMPIADCGWLTPDERAALVTAGKTHALGFGFRRCKAAEVAGWTTIKVDIQEGATDRAAVELANLTENWGRTPPTEYQFAVAAHRLVTILGYTAERVAQRAQKQTRVVEEAVQIVAKVAPDLLAHYRTLCVPEVRRKMRALAELPGHSDRERFERQRATWTAWEAQEAAERRAEPDIRTKKRHKPHARHDLRQQIREVLADGTRWPKAEHKIAAIRAMLGDGS